jgi:ribosomal protein L11 methyltransferase
VAHVAPTERAAALAIIDETVSRARADGADPNVSVRERAAHEDEWRDVWKQFFRATRVGKSFIVRPSWDPGALVAGDRVIDLDPGRAFGTGGHATTRLVIELSEELADERTRAGTPVLRFLDLGCGSGILSIAAARLWPNAAGFAADVDPEATACTLENLERNQVTTVEVATGTLELFAEAAPFDVVLANIQADVLTVLAGDLYRRIAPGGAALLSGLLTDGADAVSAAYVSAGFELIHRRQSDEWTGLALRRR